MTALAGKETVYQQSRCLSDSDLTAKVLWLGKWKPGLHTTIYGISVEIYHMYTNMKDLSIAVAHLPSI